MSVNETRPAVHERPRFEGAWETKRLGEIGNVSGSGVDKKLREGETPVRLVNYLDAYRGRSIRSTMLNHWVTAPASQAQRCRVMEGDVFFTPSSEVPDDIARSAVAAHDIADAVYSYHVVRLRPAIPVELSFRRYMCNTRAFFEQAHRLCSGSGTRYTLSLPQFRSLEIDLPPLPEQRAIAAVLSDMDAEIDALEARRDKTAAIKQGMMQELLTGRTRLPIPQEGT